MKRILFILTTFVSTSLCGQEFLTPRQFSSNQIVIIDTYQNLIAHQGEPSSVIENTWVSFTDYVVDQNDSVVDKSLRLIPVNKIDYESGLRYLKIGDSVQLNYINFQKNDFTLLMDGIVLNRHTPLRTLTKHFDISYSERKKMIGGDMYMFTYRKVKSFGIHSAGNWPYFYSIMFVFNNRNNRLVYIEFPVQFEGSIVH